VAEDDATGASADMPALGVNEVTPAKGAAATEGADTPVDGATPAAGALARTLLANEGKKVLTRLKARDAGLLITFRKTGETIASFSYSPPELLKFDQSGT
jgi:hypothetical protein